MAKEFNKQSSAILALTIAVIVVGAVAAVGAVTGLSVANRWVSLTKYVGADSQMLVTGENCEERSIIGGDGLSVTIVGTNTIETSEGLVSYTDTCADSKTVIEYECAPNHNAILGRYITCGTPYTGCAKGVCTTCTPGQEALGKCIIG